jgi:hypothetical protein
MLFKRNNEGKPSASWVMLWKGRYSNWYGDVLPG